MTLSMFLTLFFVNSAYSDSNPGGCPFKTDDPPPGTTKIRMTTIGDNRPMHSFLTKVGGSLNCGGKTRIAVFNYKSANKTPASSFDESPVEISTFNNDGHEEVTSTIDVEFKNDDFKNLEGCTFSLSAEIAGNPVPLTITKYVRINEFCKNGEMVLNFGDFIGIGEIKVDSSVLETYSSVGSVIEFLNRNKKTAEPFKTATSRFTKGRPDSALFLWDKTSGQKSISAHLHLNLVSEKGKSTRQLKDIDVTKPIVINAETLKNASVPAL